MVKTDGSEGRTGRLKVKKIEKDRRRESNRE